MHRARSEGHPEQARAVIGEDMAVRLSAELDGQRSVGRRHVHDEVRVRSSDIVEARTDESWDTIAVRFSLEGVAYEAGRDGKPVSGGTTDKRRWSEVWWFQRKAGTTTSAAPDVPLDRCPGCGAPITPTSEGTCTYCHRKLASPRTWVLTRITDSPAAPPGPFGTVTIDTSAATGAAKAIGGIVTIIVLVTVVGTVVAVIAFASRTTKR